MKVLVVHNRYRSELPSGENRVVDGEIDALRGAGVDVVTYLRSSDEIATMSAVEKLRVPFLPMHSPRAVSDVQRLIATSRPDVLHLHNPFPLISLSVVGAAARADVPVVATVHNYRYSCMRGMYFRDGHLCTLCRGKSLPWPAVQHGCYRDSRLQSLPMSVAFLAHRSDQRAVDRYIVLTETARQRLLESGLVTTNQVTVRPNSVPDPGPPAGPGSGLVFVGRLSVEKGVPLLLAAWERSGRPFGRLTVIGEGPERHLVEEAAHRMGSGVVAAGPTDAAGVSAALREAAAVVVPSTSPEGLPLVVLESFAHGRPVIASNGYGLDDVVDDSIGWSCDPTVESLASALQRAASDGSSSRSETARSVYESRYAPDVVMAAQIKIYESVINSDSRC